MSSFDLSNKALLVGLSITMWGNSKLDREATDDVIRRSGATQDAGRFTKHPMPQCDSYDALRTMAASIRSTFYANTLPWGCAAQAKANTYLLPTSRYLTTMQWFRQARQDWMDSLVPAFLSDYAAEYNGGGIYAARLGSLHRADDYPSPSDMARKFSMDIVVSRVPSTDFRCGLGADIQDELSRAAEQRIKEAHASAMRAMWERLYLPVSRAAAKLADPTAIFRDSLVSNIADICTVLPEFNVTDDPQLETLRREVVAKLTTTNPDTLRSDPLVRQKAADDAADLAARMSTVLASF
jgi:hypothetical protein